MGINSLLQNDMQSAGLAGIDRLAGNAMFPQSQMDKTQYATPSQMPTSAEVISSDYEPITNAYSGMPMQRFAKGGITALRYAEGGDTQTWEPGSNQLNLLKTDTSAIDPDTGAYAQKNIGYTIPKDSIVSFEQNTESAGGRYILKDGSTLNVDGNGTVTTATPGRNDYTLNDQGYYQPTGANLNWYGDQNRLTKTINGVEVDVPGIYHKGGYKDQQGNLRTDANGVPIPLAPNYLDSGAGKSGLADAAPYIAAAAMAAMTAGASLPESAAMMGPTYAELGYTPSLIEGATATGGALESMGPTYGELGYTPQMGPTYAELGYTPPMGPTYSELGYTGLSEGAMGPTYGELGYTGANQAQAIAEADAAAKAAAGGGGLTAKQAQLARMGLNMLSSGADQSGTGGYAPQVATASAPATVPTINRRGITGYYGAAEAPDYRTSASLMPRYQLSRIKGAPEEYTFATGGIANLGSYSDGGQLLKGPGDGMSDNIPATISDKQPARLADGEFVIPADVVSHLGNGSTDAGAKQLYKMMDKIRKARTGTKKQGKQINPNKFLP